jgi:tetratricopeptide (TPR) repeat protein
LSTSLRISAAIFLIVFGLSSGVSLAQNLRNNDVLISPNHREALQSVSTSQLALDARLSSNEIEQTNLNDAYQEVVKIHLQGDYATAVDKYRSIVIPMAERTQSDATRKKFLFLSYRGLGNCYLAMSRFAEAEETFQKLFDYLPVWTGTEDSDYAINLESIAMARMGQQHWKGAEESLQRALLIFDDQIGRTVTSVSDPGANARVNRLRMSQEMALNLFAVVYFREQRYNDSLQILERAYNQGVTYGAPADIVGQIVNDGRAVSMAIGDVDEIAIWSKRVPPTPISR